MKYTDLLGHLHRGLQPEVYLEIGVRDGNSLRLADSLSIGIDPRFNIVHEVRCDVRLYRMTSDDFFHNEDVFTITGGRRVDLAFIDGLHLAEYAFRDVLNTLSVIRFGGLIVLDDVVPSSMDIATREQLPGAWTGDVYKVALLLQELGVPLITVDTAPSGLCLMPCDDDALAERLNASSTTHEEALIGDRYTIATREELVDRLQLVDPEEALTRLGIVSPA